MDIEKLADVLKALGEPTRMKMVALLNNRDLCVCDFVPIFNISQPAVSKHLNRLKTAGLVREARKGQWVFYSLNHERLNEVRAALEVLPPMSEELQKFEEQGALTVCT